MVVDPVLAPDDLRDRVGEPSLALIEVSFYRPDHAAYAAGHIPGTRYVYWQDLLWDELRREFPAPSVLAARLGELGVGDDSTLVLVGDPVQFATYAYWVLVLSGLATRATVLDGGHATCAQRGYPLTTQVPATPTPTRTMTPATPVTPARLLRIGREEVREGLGRAGRVVLDLRSREEYVGARVAPLSAPFDHGAVRAGHIPGARHLPLERLLTPDGLFRSRRELAAAVAAVGVSRDVEAVTSCRLGHRSTLGWFVLTRLLDHPRARVYDGSWTEWGSLVGFPIER